MRRHAEAQHPGELRRPSGSSRIRLDASPARGSWATSIAGRRNRLEDSPPSPVSGTTPYTLIIDDDINVGSESIPVELLDEGAAAVAFDVMPIETGTLVNRMQTYEYRKSMTLGMALMSDAGAVANVSGAVGLFRTSDLRRQASLHSGHFPGEDLQRTLLAHLESDGRGVGFSPNQVVTLAPSSWKELFGQRAKKFGTAEHELLFLNSKLMLDARIHYSLRYERGYSVFVLLTGPLRIIFFAGLLFSPGYFLFLYLMYLPLEAAAWLRTGRRDPIGVMLLAPIYNLFKLIARFWARFQWFRLKWDYLFRHQYHRLVAGRNLPIEYAGIVVVLLGAWIVTVAGVLTRLT